MKTLIINPSEEQSKSIAMLEPDELLKALLTKVCKTNYPVLVNDEMVRLFIANVEEKAVGIYGYSRVALNTYDDVKRHFNYIGTMIYGPNWTDKIIINEISYDRDAKKVFGLSTKDEKLIKRLVDELDAYYIIKYGESTNSQKNDLKADPVDKQEVSHMDQPKNSYKKGKKKHE